ncbi:glycosyltransferase 87 family protein [Acidocella sp. KAb 2-4]|uniref:glycosyltransferase 87 family protein n=1 Tax=Acidocella sp. KAb 2-4 TaxID=2885158 RepID=UPI001D07D674|nr:glycosyltransferase 87 family protein [Acidocella sp. KAb 2-4]MCB5943796.1 glycosyltransferase 87 family protein [Acidocella sp. KAb 2-4]
MAEKSQFQHRVKLSLLVGLCALPSVFEAVAVIWGVRHGLQGKALRDGLDFWAGGFLLRHGQLPVLFDHTAYQAFLEGLYGKLPYHLWSYPPTYGLLASVFAGLPPWPAVLSFDAASLALLALVLRLAGQSWWFVAAMLLAPATLESVLEHQNAELMTALIGGGLLLGARPRLGGALIGLATVKPQLGLVLPLYLLRRAPIGFMYAALAAAGLAAASLWAFGPAAWAGFMHYTSPVMSNVLLTGQPPEFAGGLVSVFAVVKPYLGLGGAMAAQGLVSVAAVLAGLKTRSVPALLILSALASPYLHVYDLLITTLATALLVRERLRSGFAPGEPVLFFLAWFAPGLLPWAPQYAHLVPVALLLLLASAWRRGAVPACDS